MASLRNEAPKTPRKMGCGKGVSPPIGKGFKKKAVPLPPKF